MCCGASPRMPCDDEPLVTLPEWEVGTELSMIHTAATTGPLGAIVDSLDLREELDQRTLAAIRSGLIVQGVSNAEVCRRVGSTGERGHAGASGARSSTRPTRRCSIPGACSDATEAATSSVLVVGGADDDVRTRGQRR